MDKPNWYIYDVAPIDWLWNALMTPEIAETMLANVGEEDEYEPNGAIDPTESLSAERFRRDLAIVKALAAEVGWEGDFVGGGPRVFWLPAPEQMTFAYAFVWKQRNNGTTYVISPLPLTWLDQHR